MDVFQLDTETMLMRLLFAALLGGLIGWERERRNKQAGLKPISWWLSDRR